MLLSMSRSVASCLHSDVAGPSHHHRVRSVLEELLLRGPVLVLLFLLLLFIDLIKVLHHGTTRPRASRGRDRERHDADEPQKLTKKKSSKDPWRQPQKKYQPVPETIRFTSLSKLRNKTSTSAAVTIRHRKRVGRAYVGFFSFFFLQCQFTDFYFIVNMAIFYFIDVNTSKKNLLREIKKTYLYYCLQWKYKCCEYTSGFICSQYLYSRLYLIPLWYLIVISV